MPSTASYDYTTLVAAIQTWAEDDSTEFQAVIDDIIARGESRLYTGFNLEIFNGFIRTGVLTADVNLQAIKPATWQGTRSLHLTPVGGGARQYLIRRSYEYCVDYEPIEANTDTPLYFCEFSDTEFFVSPAPDVAYPFVLREISNDPTLHLSGTQANTWLGNNQGDLLLDCCMIEAELYLKADEFDVTKWKANYDSKLPERRAEIRSLIKSGYTPLQNAARTVDDRQ